MNNKQDRDKERERKRRAKKKINKMPQESYHLFELLKVVSLAIKVRNLMAFQYN